MLGRHLIVSLSVTTVAMLTFSAVYFMLAKDDSEGDIEEDNGEGSSAGNIEKPDEETEGSGGDNDEFTGRVEIAGPREGLYVESVRLHSVRSDDGSSGFRVGFIYFGFDDDGLEEVQPRRPQRLILEAEFLQNGPSTS